VGGWVRWTGFPDNAAAGAIEHACRHPTKKHPLLADVSSSAPSLSSACSALLLCLPCLPACLPCLAASEGVPAHLACPWTCPFRSSTA
jgi:hypothetical protein